MQWTPYSAMSDAIARYVSDEREGGLDAEKIASDIQGALEAALGDHLNAM